ncbi:MAG: hypothetical protein J5818_04990 [Eggerthellaceae bacterium]|nr:hypothetical protein [Eggerthellaceae bacterium]
MKGLVSAIVIVAVIALGIAAGTFALAPYGSKSEVVWSEFRQTDDIDTICLGSSLAAHAYDPAAVDPICGTASFNMSTPLQETDESYLGLKEAMEHHEIKRVIYGVDYAAFIGEPNLYPARVFENEKWKGDPFTERFSDLAYMLDSPDWLFDERSINWLFPWTEQQASGGGSGILRNIRMRLDGTTLIEAAEINEEDWHYYGRGYGNELLVMDYNDDTQEDFATVAQFSSRPFSEKKLASLADMAELCAANGIEFIAVVPALPDFSLIGLKDYYYGISEQIRRTVEAHGGSFYDFNVADPSFYQAQEDHFEDYQHYNAAGGAAFSEAFAKLISARESGEDVSGWFTTYDERLADIDHISAVRLFPSHFKGDKPGDRINAKCYTGPNVKVEYRFLAKAADEEEFRVVRDWSPEDAFDFVPEHPGRYTMRVEARQQGSDPECERWSEHVVRI